MSLNQSSPAARDLEESLSEFHLLAEQLGSADSLLSLGSVAASLAVEPVRDLPSLDRFLASYRTEVLGKIELPGIQAAYLHASRGEARELIALDQKMSREISLGVFVAASQRVGRHQLKRLRPLRDVRLVQRYLAAVQSGQAEAWHTLVYGVILATYSFPLRQGMINYAERTLESFAHSAARQNNFSETDIRRILEGHLADLPQLTAALLAGPGLIGC
jgi:urease accessory protein UreF